MGVRFIYFSGNREQITPGMIEDGPSDAKSASGPDPTVTLGLLGEQLTNISFLEIGEPVKSWSRQVEMPDDPDEREIFFYEYGIDLEATPEELEAALIEISWGISVQELNDQLRDALAAVPLDGCRQVAMQWAAIEELAGWSVDEVVTVLENLSDLARDAARHKQHLYCRSML